MFENYHLKIVYIVLFLNFIAIGLVVPSLPIIINQLNLNGSAFGILISTFSLFQLIISPIANVLFKKQSRKFVLIIAIILYILSEFLFGIGYHFVILLISRILGGVSAGLIMSISLALVGEFSDETEKNKNFSTLSAITSLALILGPGIGALLSMFSLRLPYFIASILGLTMLIVILLFYKYEDVIPSTKQKLNLKIQDFKLGLFPAFMVFTLAFGLSSIEELYPLYLVDIAQFKSVHIGIAIIVGSILGVLAQYYLYPVLSEKISAIKIMLYSSVFSIIVLFVLLTLKSILSLILISSIIFIGFDMLRPAIAIYLSNLYKDNQTFAGSLNSTFTALGNLLAPIIGGYVYEYSVRSPIYIALMTLILGVTVILFANTFMRRYTNPK